MKIIFLFPNTKIVTTNWEEIDILEDYLRSEEVEVLAKAYEEAKKDYRI